MKDREKQSNQNEDQKNWLEWMVFGVSLALLLTVFGYLVYQVINYTPQDPEVYAKGVPDPSEMEPNRYKVIVYNKGGTTAEEVTVEFTLYKNGDPEEVSELVIPFSPKDSERTGWVLFTTSPAAADSVIARIVSYEKP